MAAQKAKQIDFLLAGLHNSSGQPIKAAKIFIYESSAKTTQAIVWKDSDKGDAHSQPIIAGNRGEATVFADRDLYIEIFENVDGEDILFKTYDQLSYSREVDFGGLYIDVGSLYGTSGPDIQAALDDIDPSVNAVILFKDAVFTISQDITVPTNVLCKIMPTADMAVGSGITFTLNGNVEAEEYPIFSGAGTVVLANQKLIFGIWGSNITQLPTGFVPVGAAIPWLTATVPSGYLECNGANISRTTYVSLFSILAETYGNGDGSTTFTLPDLRGESLRGFDNGAGNDPDAGSRTDRGDGATGDNVGTKQLSINTAHTHDFNTRNWAQSSGNNPTIPATDAVGGAMGIDDGGAKVASTIGARYKIGNLTFADAGAGNGWVTNPGGSSIARFYNASQGGNESRPRNVAVMWIIKT